MHARAQVEKGVKWINDKSEVEGEEAKEYWLCWVTTERSESTILCWCYCMLFIS